MSRRCTLRIIGLTNIVLHQMVANLCGESRTMRRLNQMKHQISTSRAACTGHHVAFDGEKLLDGLDLRELFAKTCAGEQIAADFNAANLHAQSRL